MQKNKLVATRSQMGQFGYEVHVLNHTLWERMEWTYMRMYIVLQTIMK